MPKTVEEGKGRVMLEWVGLGDDDYIAARQLLLAQTNDSIVQATGLSNTAIEKYLKALCIALDLEIPKGGKNGHDASHIYKKIKEEDISLEINEEYLELLYKAYGLRYRDKLQIGFNITLCKIKLLVELDHTVYEIKKGMSFKKNGEKINTRLDTLLEQKAPALLEKNCYFGDCDRPALFEEESPCYELRVDKGRKIIESSLMRRRIKDNGKFDIEALKPDGKATYKVAKV